MERCRVDEARMWIGPYSLYDDVQGSSFGCASPTVISPYFAFRKGWAALRCSSSPATTYVSSPLVLVLIV